MPDTHTLSRMRSDRDLLNLIFSYIPQIAEQSDLDELLVLIASFGRDLVLADRCSIWLLSDDKKTLWTKVAQGIDFISISAEQGVVGYSLKTGESLLIPDAYLDDRFDDRVDKASGYRTRSVMTVPFTNSEQKIMGVFQAINKVGNTSFTEDDLNFLKMVAVYSAKSLESAKFFAEIQKTQEEIAVILGEVSECRSHETGNHVKRVAEMSYKIARYYGLPEKESLSIKIASIMHDLGKIGIPDSVLNKPGRLTDEEFKLMKMHAHLGAVMLRHSNCNLLKLAASIADTHHERFDGKGYPNGLKGENIPLPGRICAVADVFDALTNARCYKDPWPKEKVLQLFKEERGAQFQAELVDILLEHVDEFYAVNALLPN